MKALAKKHREKCGKRFEECTRLASCSINCIGGIKSHPECETGFYCRYDDDLCDGRCEHHRLVEDIRRKNMVLSHLKDSESSIMSAIMQMEAEKDELKRQLEQLEYED